MAKAKVKESGKTVFKNRDEVIEFLEKSFINLSYIAIIDRKKNVLHEYYSNDKKIAYTEYFYDKKDIEKMKFKHKLIYV